MTQRLWFKRKWFGWGWRPASKEGWLVTIGFLLAIIAWSTLVDPEAPGMFPVWILGLLVLAGALIVIAYKTGEKPKWSWGVPKE